MIMFNIEAFANTFRFDYLETVGSNGFADYVLPWHSQYAPLCYCYIRCK